MTKILNCSQQNSVNNLPSQNTDKQEVKQELGLSSLITIPSLKHKIGILTSVTLPTLSLSAHKPTFDFTHNILINNKSSTEPEVNIPESISKEAQKCTRDESLSVIALITADQLNIAISNTPNIFTYGDIAGIPSFTDGIASTLLGQLDTLTQFFNDEQAKQKVKTYSQDIRAILNTHIVPKVDLGQFGMQKGLTIDKFTELMK